MSTKSRKRAIGNHAKSRKNIAKRELLFKSDGTEYGKVIESLGGTMLRVHCFDGTTRLCQIRGTMRRREWVNKSDIVLVSLRSFQDAKCDLLVKYSSDEVVNLIAYDEIPPQDGDDAADVGPSVVFGESSEAEEMDD